MINFNEFFEMSVFFSAKLKTFKMFLKNLPIYRFAEIFLYVHLFPFQNKHSLMPVG